MGFIGGSGDVEVVESAIVPVSLDASHPRRNLALFAGLALSLGLAFVLEHHGASSSY